MCLLLCGFGHDVAGLGWEAGAFELDGDVVNTEGVMELRADGAEDGFAFVHVHVRDAGVAAQGVEIAAERPDVHVMHFHHAGHGEDGAGDFFDVHVLRTAFEKKMAGCAQDADARPQDEQADREAQDRVNPTAAGVMNRDGTGNDGDIGDRVAEVVNQNRAEIQIFVAAHHGKRDAAVDGKRGDGSPDHPAFDDGDGRAQAVNCFPAEPEREQHKQHGVGERGERSGAMVAIGLVAVGGAFGPTHGEPGDAERGHIGKIVHGIVQQRDASAKDAAENFGEDEPQCGDHGPGKNARFQRRMRVPVVRMTVPGMRMAVIESVVVAGVGVLAHESLFYDRFRSTPILMPDLERRHVGAGRLKWQKQ